MPSRRRKATKQLGKYIKNAAPSFPTRHYYKMARAVEDKNVMQDSRGRLYVKDSKTGEIRRMKT